MTGNMLRSQPYSERREEKTKELQASEFSM